MSRDLARFAFDRLADELAAVTGVIPFADPGAPTSDERNAAANHLQAELHIVGLYKTVAENDGGDHEWAYGYATGLGDAVRRIAAYLYSDHPDYRQEWAP